MKLNKECINGHVRRTDGLNYHYYYLWLFSLSTEQLKNVNAQKRLYYPIIIQIRGVWKTA